MTVTINGSTGISGVDGSAATPALQGGDTNTGIVFGTDTVGVSTGGVQRTTVDSSGRLLVGVGSANANGGVLQLSGGITLPATQAASTDPNTLDDYEEGTFTPGVSGVTTVSGTPAYSGRYVKIGKMVYAEIRQTAGTITVAAGNQFTGLPFIPGTDSAVGSFSCASTSKSGITNAYTNGSLYINQLISTGTSLTNFIASISYLVA
jgi:hypothetical protein